jgi:hypothetical protein
VVKFYLIETLRGPEFNDEEDIRALWFLSREDPIRACTLGKGDILLIGRKDELTQPERK